MRDYSIEYAHIYSNQILGEEQLLTVNVLQEVISELSNNSNTFIKVVLLDDYNPKENTLDINLYIKSLKAISAEPDVIVFEKDLVNYMDEFYKLLPSKKVATLERAYERQGVISCSTFIAVWYLLRLGIIGGRDNNIVAARELINILPRKYQGVEKIALDLLRSCKSIDIINKIHYKYIE